MYSANAHQNFRSRKKGSDGEIAQRSLFANDRPERSVIGELRRIEKLNPMWFEKFIQNPYPIRNFRFSPTDPNQT